MNQTEILGRLKACKTTDEWNKVCLDVKRACNGGYPDWWYATVIVSGLMRKTLGDGSDQITIKDID